MMNDDDEKFFPEGVYAGACRRGAGLFGGASVRGACARGEQGGEQGGGAAACRRGVGSFGGASVRGA